MAKCHPELQHRIIRNPLTYYFIVILISQGAHLTNDANVRAITGWQIFSGFSLLATILCKPNPLKNTWAKIKNINASEARQNNDLLVRLQNLYLSTCNQLAVNKICSDETPAKKRLWS